MRVADSLEKRQYQLNQQCIFVILLKKQKRNVNNWKFLMDIIKGNVRMIIRIGEAVLYKAFEFYTSIYRHEFFLMSFIHLFIISP